MWNQEINAATLLAIAAAVVTAAATTVASTAATISATVAKINVGNAYNYTLSR